MFDTINLSTVRFAAPEYLQLLVIPGTLLVVWVWQFVRRRREAGLMRRHRHVPRRERLPLLGDLAYWLCLLGALAATIVALARPIAVVSAVQTSGIDLVILQDGSASMRVRDVQGDRWRRSMRFLRTLGESLRWDDDRVALALFASIATPQVRLTRDPNTFFFFLDNLGDEPPFRLEDDTTWDTNIERGIYWGLRLIEKDEEMAKESARRPEPPDGESRGASGMSADAPPPTITVGAQRKNSRAFVLVSDGQAWSGEVANSIALSKQRNVPIFVVGVGTSGGGTIPDPQAGPTRPLLTSTLDRSSLAVIAGAGGGRYFELDREDDRDIANAIIESTRRRAATGSAREMTEPLYWRALALAALLLGLGSIFLRDRAALTLQLAAAAAILVLLVTVAR